MVDLRAGAVLTHLRNLAALLAAFTMLAAGADLLAPYALTAAPLPAGQVGAQESSTPVAGNPGNPKPDVKQRARTDLYGDPLPPRALLRLGTVRFRHGGQVNALALSPQGKTLATASEDGTLRLWDAATGRELRRFTEQDRVRSLAFTPDGTILASVGGPGNHAVRLWEVTTGKLLRKLESPGHWFGRVAVSPDGKMVAASADRHRIVLWETGTGRLLHTLDGREQSNFPGPIAFSPDGQTLASGSNSGSIHLWNVATGQGQRRFVVQPPLPEGKGGPPWYHGMIQTLAFSPDGRTLASGAQQSPIRLWDMSTGKEIRTLPGDRAGTFSLAFSPDGGILASGEATGMVRTWEPATGKELGRFHAHGQWVSGLAFAREDHTLATIGDASIRLWDVRTRKEIVPDRGHSGAIGHCALLPDQRTLITASRDSTIREWDLVTGKELRRSTPLHRFDQDVVLARDGKTAAFFKREPVGDNEVHVSVRLCDLTSRKELAVLWRPNIFRALFSPDGKILFTRSWDVKERAGLILAWEVATGKELRVVARHTNSFDSMILSPDGKMLAGIPRGEQSINLWDAATGKELRRIPASAEFNQAIAFSSDSRTLAVADGPRPMPDSRVLTHHIHLWDIATGNALCRFAPSARGYWPVTFSPDGRTLATADEDNRIRLWEIATGGERLQLAGHAGRIGSLLFADNGRTLVSASSDTTALVWDVTGLHTRRTP